MNESEKESDSEMSAEICEKERERDRKFDWRVNRIEKNARSSLGTRSSKAFRLVCVGGMTSKRPLH